MEFAIQLVFSGISVGAVYALIAMGMVLTFWTTRVINFGHGSLLMVGALLTVVLGAGRLGFYKAVPIALGITAILMVLAERAAVRPLVKLTGSMGWIVSTLGLGIFLQGFAAKFFGSQAVAFPSLLFTNDDTIPFLGIRLSAQYLSILVLSLLIMAAMELFLRRTAWGRAVRAVAHDPDLSSIMGIPGRRIVVLSFAASGILAGVAGIMTAQITGTIDPAFGFNLMVLGFVATVIGGMGSSVGALAGGIFLGVLEKLVGGYISTAAQHGIAFAVLMVVLAVRPQGLFGKEEITKI
jgi:branched-chain amino acid transport system permease protein